MDKLREKIREGLKNGNTERGGVFKKARRALSKGGGERRILFGVLLFVVGALLSRTHLMFGAHPFGVALVAVLPYGVFETALGAVVGALTLGGRGVIYSMIAVITLFIRVIISGGRQEGGELFGENLLLRMSAATVGSFVAAVYEVLLRGFGDGVLLYGITMILTPPAIVFLLSGLFNTGISPKLLVVGDGRALSLRGKRDTEKYNVIFFLISLHVALFLISLSLRTTELLGINFSFVFSSVTTLVAAKRFGPLFAMAVGFVSALPGGILSVSFALAGLGAGLLFSFGTAYAIVAGAMLLFAWGGYVQGAVGLLATLPEYMIGAALVSPIVKKVSEQKTEQRADECERSAKDMVGTMALSYTNKYSGSLDLLEDSLTQLASVIRAYSAAHPTLSEDEYRSVVIETANEKCKSCPDRNLCAKENIQPAVKGASRLAAKLAARERISFADVNGDTEFCAHAQEVAEAIKLAAAAREKEDRMICEANSSAEEYELIAKLISEARAKDEIEKSVDSSLGAMLSEVMENHGITDGVASVFGNRKKHFILCAEDETGAVISSEKLRLDVEAKTGVKLGEPEFWRSGRMAMMECSSRKRYAVECSTASVAGDEEEISGDSTAAFESRDGYYFALLSDGMGKGEIARDTSEFVAKFLTRVLDFSPSYESALHLLNYVMRARREECSATVDLFSLDLYSGEATFIKSGAAPSFVKRDESIFRIKSQTAPLGLVKSIDSERVKVEIRYGDYVILLSDGILQTAEDAPWLLELLAKEPKRSLSDYAEFILSEALKNSRSHDDMSVTVLHILPV